MSFEIIAKNEWESLTQEEYTEKLVSCNLKIKELEWSRFLWPKENKKSKPKFENIISLDEIKLKIIKNLKMQTLLKQEFNFGITSRMIEADIERMIVDSADKVKLVELFSILNNDPYEIGQCISRSYLVSKKYFELNGVISNNQLNIKFNTIGVSGLPRPTPSFAFQTRVENSIRLMQVMQGNNTWLESQNNNPPSSRHSHTAIWTGNDMIIWGGNDDDNYFNSGMKYNPVTDSWIQLELNNSPSARRLHTAVWTGTEMIIWGGYGGHDVGLLDSGAKYNALLDKWVILSNDNSPSPRRYHTSVYTGEEMIVWGGTDGEYLNTGYKYNLDNDSWSETEIQGSPSGRVTHSAIYTGTEMLIWGGHDENNLNTGAKYNPVNNTWIPMEQVDAPEARRLHTVVLHNNEMIIWGGRTSSNVLNTGFSYNFVDNIWSPVSNVAAPSPRILHTVVDTEKEMIIWGGYNFGGAGETNTGSMYNYDLDEWSQVTSSNAPDKRHSHTAIYTGKTMVIWGGAFDDGITNVDAVLNSIGLYQAHDFSIFKNGFE